MPRGERNVFDWLIGLRNPTEDEKGLSTDVNECWTRYGLEKEQKHGGRRLDCFSLLYFGNSQIFLILFAFQT